MCFFHSNQKLRPICRIKIDDDASEHEGCMCNTNVHFFAPIILPIVQELFGLIATKIGECDKDDGMVFVSCIGLYSNFKISVRMFSA